MDIVYKKSQPITSFKQATLGIKKDSGEEIISSSIPPKDAGLEKEKNVLVKLKRHFKALNKRNTDATYISIQGFNKSLENSHPRLALFYARSYLSQINRFNEEGILPTKKKITALQNCHKIYTSFDTLIAQFNEVPSDDCDTSNSRDCDLDEGFFSGSYLYKYNQFYLGKINTVFYLDALGASFVNGPKTRSEKLVYKLCESLKRTSTTIEEREKEIGFLFDYAKDLSFEESKVNQEIITLYTINMHYVTKHNLEKGKTYQPDDELTGVGNTVSVHRDAICKWRKQAQKINVSNNSTFMFFSEKAKDNFARLTMKP